MRNQNVRSHNPGTRRIVFAASEGAQILDVTGPLQIFSRAADILQRKHPSSPRIYVTEVLSTSREKSIRTSCGITLIADSTYQSVRGKIDTLLVCGGNGAEQSCEEPSVIRWLRRKVKQTRRFGSICTGAFLLARAGLLERKRVATHWKWCEILASRHPNLAVDPDPIFIKDGNVYTSAGVTAGMDLALALVEEDFGAELALQVAREMVLYLRRPGGQSQFSAALSMQMSDKQPMQQLHSWVLANLSKRLSVEDLAARVFMSPRNFARIFLRETGATPGRYLERLRVEAACRRLEETQGELNEIAADCGFGGAESMRRVFLRTLGVTPGNYRKRFSRNVRLFNQP